MLILESRSAASAASAASASKKVDSAAEVAGHHFTGAVAIEVDESRRTERRQRQQRVVPDQPRRRSSPIVSENDALAFVSADDQVEVTIVVEVDECGVAAPSDIDAIELVAYELESGISGSAGVAIEVQCPGCFSGEHIEIAVVIDVHEGRRGVAAATEANGSRGVLHPLRLLRRTGVGEKEHAVVPRPEQQLEPSIGVEVSECRCVVV